LLPGSFVVFAFLAFYFLAPIELSIRIALSVLGLALLAVGLLTVRSMVLVIEDERFWLDGRWRSVDEVSSVTLRWDQWPGGRQLWRRSFIVLVFFDNTTFSPVLRYTRSAAMRDGRQLARQLGVSFSA
jgi:hypothetical protein